jgi:hypothetical protein
LWEVRHTFPAEGKYKLWADIACSGATFTLAQPLLTVSGEQKSAAAKPDVSNRVKVSGLEISISHTEPLIAGATNDLVFTIRDDSGQTVETEDFLGAPMHLVVIGANLSGYRHAHPEPVSLPVLEIRFRQVFDQPGRYKLFAQFRPSGTHLGRDEALLAEFGVDVLPANGVSSVSRR